MTTSTGVAAACAEVVRRARHVRIEDNALDAVVPEILQRIPKWDTALHYFDGTWRSANYVLVLDALNFSFWPDPGAPRWTISYGGHNLRGYQALAAALRLAIQEKVRVLEAAWLAEITSGQVERILHGSEGTIPLMEQRLAHLREVGQLLTSRYDGRFSNMVEDARFDAVDLTLRLAAELPSFNDATAYEDVVVPFYKRAQITAVDLHGTFGGTELGNLRRLDSLTAFADYKVPQVLRRLGILTYDEALAATVDRKALIPAGDPREVEIRAATVESVERIRRHPANTVDPGVPSRRAFEIDWALWEMGQHADADDRPYHRTRTIFY